MTRVHITLSHYLPRLLLLSERGRGGGSTVCLVYDTVHRNSSAPPPTPWRLDTLVVELSLGPGNCRLDTKFRVRWADHPGPSCDSVPPDGTTVRNRARISAEKEEKGREKKHRHPLPDRGGPQKEPPLAKSLLNHRAAGRGPLGWVSARPASFGGEQTDGAAKRCSSASGCGARPLQ